MSNQEIITKAIKKAVTGGFDQDLGAATIDWLQKGLLDFNTPEGALTIRGFIFDQDFAEALWGDKFINPEMRDDTGSKVIAFKQTSWRHHLRQMVVAEDPIKYLRDNL